MISRPKLNVFLNMTALCAGALAGAALYGACFDRATDTSAVPEGIGLQGPCYEYDAETRGVGVCEDGMLVGYLDGDGTLKTTCFGSHGPANEVCDGRDNDCSGFADDHQVCVGSILEDAFGDGVVWEREPGELGPTLVRRPNLGSLASCRPEETFEVCADRFVAEHGDLWGADKTSINFNRDELVATAAGLHAVYEQRLSDLPVFGSRVVVHGRDGTPARLRWIQAHAPPIPANLPLDALVGLDDLAHIVDEAVIDAQLGIRPVDESAGLAWRVLTAAEPDVLEPSSEWFIDAISGNILAHSSLVSQDLQIDDAADATSAFALVVPTANYAAFTPPPPAGAGVANQQLGWAAEASIDFLLELTMRFNRDGTDGVGGAITATVNADGLSGLPCSPICSGFGLLGFMPQDGVTPSFCCQPTQRGLAETVVHELVHGVWDHVAMPKAGLEGEATEHALTEVLSEQLTCLLWSDCDWLHAGRDYSAQVNPGDGCSSPVAIANLADPTAFELCPDGGNFLDNRVTWGRALFIAACSMGDTCTSQTVAMPSPSEFAARRRLSALIFETASSRPANGNFVTVAQAMLSVCTDSVGQNLFGDVISVEDCAALQRGFSETGILACLAIGEEVCDGIDNDCDGLTDEALAAAQDQTLERPCFDGPPAALAVGVCKAGVERCLNGAWGLCEDERLPAPEICDGLDNDCDGVSDDDGVLVVHVFDLDGDGFGSGPEIEFCPGAAPARWLAATGTARDCDDTNALVHPSADGVAETQCGNLVDDDCDTVLDDGCPGCPWNAVPRICGPTTCVGAPLGTPGCTAFGSCTFGRQHCEWRPDLGVFAWSDACVGATDGSAFEVCNGEDDDCDGETDEAPLANVADVCQTGLGAGHEECVQGAVSCAVDSFFNACGGIAMLDSTPGDPCPGGVSLCTGPNQVTCAPVTGPVAVWGTVQHCDGVDSCLASFQGHNIARVLQHDNCYYVVELATPVTNDLAVAGNVLLEGNGDNCVVVVEARPDSVELKVVDCGDAGDNCQNDSFTFIGVGD